VIAPPVLTPAAKQVEDKGASAKDRATRRDTSQTPGSRSTLEPDDDIIDVTNDVDPKQRAESARLAAARAATRAALRAARGRKYPSTNVRANIETDKLVDTISLARGFFKGTPSQVAAQVQEAYEKIINEQADECANRTKASYRTVFQKVLSVVILTQRAKNLNDLVSVHMTNGRDNLNLAFKMHEQEHKATEDMLEKVYEPLMADHIKKNSLQVQAARAKTVENLIKSWDKLFSAIQGYPLKDRQAMIESSIPASETT
jgi:hypothetical protein